MYKILLFISILLAVIGQLLLKHGMSKIGRVRIRLNTLFKILSSYRVVLGVFLYLLSFLFWVIILTKLDLSLAYPAVSSTYFFIVLFSKIFFNENVSKKRWISIFIIILGVVLISLS